MLFPIAINQSNATQPINRFAKRHPICVSPNGCAPYRIRSQPLHQPAQQPRTTYQHQVSYDEFQALATQIQRLEIEMSQLAKEKKGSRGLQGVPGPAGVPSVPGPAGVAGPPGIQAPTVNIDHLRSRTTNLENKLNQVVEFLDTNPPRNQPPENPRNPQAGQSAKHTDETQPHWLTKALRPVAAMVGTAYAGPVAGAVVTAWVGYAGWFFFRRKKKTPKRQRKLQEQRPPPVPEGVTENDLPDEELESQNSSFDDREKNQPEGKRQLGNSFQDDQQAAQAVPKRNVDELHQNIQLGRLEGHDPLLDAAFGMFVQDEAAKIIEDDSYSKELRNKVEDIMRSTRRRVDSVAPLSTKN